MIIEKAREFQKNICFTDYAKVFYCVNFPQFVVIHTVKGFTVVREAEVDVFLEFPCFLYDPMDVGNLTSDSSAFSKFKASESSVHLEFHSSHTVEAWLGEF